MPVSDAARHDLYNGLADLLGPQRAETLMSYLPEFDPQEIATKTDLAATTAELAASIDAVKTELREFKTEMREFKTEMREFKTEMRDFRVEVQAGLAAVNGRIDRLFLTLVAGLFVIVAAMASVIFSTL